MITVLSPQGVVRGSYENNMPESTPYFDDLFTDNLETMETSLRFSVPLESPDSEWLEGFSTVLYPDKDGNLRELTVINVWEDWSQEQPVKTAVCEDASIDSLLKTHTAPFVAGSLEEAIHGALAASDWQFILAADTLNIGYQLIEVKEYSNVRSVLETIRQAYGIEYRFVVKFDGARITRQLQVYKEYGQHTGKYFIYNRDLTNIEREVDFSNVFTAALPYWIEDDAAQTIAGYTPRNPVKGFRKDYTMDNVQHIAAHDEFDRTDKSRMLIFKASSNNPELAYLEACNKLLDYISPTYTYTVNVLLLENILGFEGTEEIHLGDYVWLKEKVGDAEIGLEARVIQLTSSHTSPEQDEVVFTNFKEISVADSDEVNALRDLIQQIQEQQDEISEAVTQTTVDIAILQQGQAGIITNLEGKSSISIGDNPNPNPQQGDTWFTDAVDPETGKIYSTIKVWNAVTNDWEPRYSAKDAEEALAAANEAAQAGADAKAAADAAKVAADDATAAGDEALAKVEQATVEINSAKDRINSIEIGVVDLTDNLAATDALANVAKDNAALAQTAANTAQTAAQEAKAAADEAQGTANAALTSAGSAGTAAQEAKTAATNAHTAANNAQEAANTAGINAQKAIEDAQTAFDKAEDNGGKIQEVVESVDGITSTVASVKTTADSALSKATTVETTVNGVKTTVAQVQEDLEATDARVTTNETSIGGIKTSVSQVKTTADSALSKATTTETTVNGLKTTITSVETTANSALTKANTAQSTADGNKTTIASVKTTADSALTKANTVEQTVDGISTTLTSVQEDLNGNITKVNEISDTVDGHTASIKSVTTTANNALTKANTVETTINGQKTTISSIQSDLSTNVTKVNQISDTVDGHTSLISSVTTTAGNALSKANTAQSTADGNTAKITAVTTTANNALTKANTLEETVDGVTRTISQVESDLNGLEIGGRNYAKNSRRTLELSNVTNNGNYLNGDVPYNLADLVGKTVTISVEIEVKNAQPQTSGSIFRIGCEAYMPRASGGTFYLGVWENLSAGQTIATKRISRTLSIPNDIVATQARGMHLYVQANGDYFRVSKSKIEIGNKATDWTPAPEDMATVTQVNQITDTVDSHTQLIASTTATASSALTKATSVEQTANGLKTSVSSVKTTADSALSKATTTETTVNGLSTKINSVETTANSAVTKANTAQSTADGNKATIASVKTTADSALSKATTVETTVNGLKTTVSSVEKTANSALTKATSVEQTANGLTTTVSEVQSDLSGFKSTTATQIKQLSDNINLKVDKNGVIAQINVSSEGVLIDGKNVWITGLTKIDNAVIKTAAIADLAVTTTKIANLAVGTAQIGSAAITEAKIGNLAVTTAKIADLAVTNAKIGSLSANKITTGTLDAGVISVINLNASNIKSGTLSGLKVESPYDVPIASGATSNRRGALVITDGYLRNVYQTYVRSSGTVTGNGELTLTHEALTAVSRTGASTTVADNSMQLHAFGLTLQNSAGQGGTLSFQDLYSQATTSLMPASGWSQYSNDPKNGNHPTVTRQGRLVTLAGAFSNNNQLPADNNSYTMTTIPVGYRPAQLVKWLAKGSGTSIFMITVESNGTLYINYRLGSASGGFGYVVNASGNLFNIAGSYSAADI